jgi:hypothetical protein
MLSKKSNWLPPFLWHNSSKHTWDDALGGHLGLVSREGGNRRLNEGKLVLVSKEASLTVTNFKNSTGNIGHRDMEVFCAPIGSKSPRT